MVPERRFDQVWSASCGSSRNFAHLFLIVDGTTLLSFFFLMPERRFDHVWSASCGPFHFFHHLDGGFGRRPCLLRPRVARFWTPSRLDSTVSDVAHAFIGRGWRASGPCLASSFASAAASDVARAFFGPWVARSRTLPGLSSNRGSRFASTAASDGAPSGLSPVPSPAAGRRSSLLGTSWGPPGCSRLSPRPHGDPAFCGPLTTARSGPPPTLRWGCPRPRWGPYPLLRPPSDGPFHGPALAGGPALLGPCGASSRTRGLCPWLNSGGACVVITN